MMTAEEHEAIGMDLGSFTHDPLGAVLYGFPWGEAEFEGSTGPWKWQREVLEDIGAHLQNPETRHRVLRIGISSGHGIGKSSLVGMVCWWALTTCGDCKVLITANTGSQLDTKTQPEIAKWFRSAINSEWFDVHVTSIKSREGTHEQTWRADFETWSENNTQAFAGLHNRRRRIVLIFDEASEIHDKIWEVAHGALTDSDTEIIWLACGNPTWNHGEFYEAVFGRQSGRWHPRIIDSRDVEGTNKEEIAEELAIYGEDSDRFRVRYRGIPPRASSAQYIDMDLIRDAQKRKVTVLDDEPLVAGVDFAWGGEDDNVIQFRRGLDARSVPPIRIKGEFTRDPAVLTGKLSDVLTKSYDGRKVAMLFLDSAGIAAPVESRLRQLNFRNILTVNFGAHSPDTRYAYMRDYMWGRMKEWLAVGAIDTDAQLEADLSGPCLVSDKQQRVKLEDKELMKKRGLKSPDRGDALALTFAMPVAPQEPESPVQQVSWNDPGQGWMS